MKTNKKNSTTLNTTWMRFFGWMLMMAFITPAIIFSQAAPVLQTPADVAVNISTSPTLSWTTVAGDSIYHLQISTSNIFADTMYNDSALTGSSYIISGLANNTTYYWHVRVKKNFPTGTSPYSTNRSFTTWLLTPTPAPPPLPVALGSAGRFAVLSHTGITNILSTSITGDVGVSPTDGTSMTGWNLVTVVGTTFTVGPAGPLPSGSFTQDPTLLTQAKSDLTTAYNDAAGRTVNPIAISGNLGGRTLYPGLYKSTGTLEISAGDLTFDAQNDTNAVWIIQIATSFNVTPGRQVFLVGGALTSNIFWQVGSLASFGTTSVMKGTILAGTAITFATGATLDGRALAKTANVTMQGNSIVRPAIPAVFNNPESVDLGLAGNYRALAGTDLSIAASCTIDGNVGGNTVTNLGSGNISGTTDEGVAINTSITALNGAITEVSGRTPNATLGPQLAGTTLGRGIYNSTNGTFSITGTLILTGTAIDTFIFQMGTTLTTAANSNVMLIGGALSSNVIWQVGTAAEIGANSDFKGIILAGTYITQSAGVSMDGRALGLTAVTLGGNSVALPVELASFTATPNRKNVELRWSTATEVNNHGFAVERKTIDTWNKVGFVDGAGTSNTPKNYLFTDNNLTSGKYSYRLKQIDRDGKFEYSQSVEVTIGQTVKEFALMQNYPNPFNPTTMISYQIPASNNVSLKVFDALGREVATLVNETKEAGSYSAHFDASQLSSGVYIYRLEAGSFVSTKKLVLMK